ncbi:MAG TPA: carboxypeptidase-like regulatory domain-containing protein [Acidobacteriaceae bacterium]|jgi:hypothetical protein|nr:carboxypeptidase-like regulatory domain-containing protein [Acidobacteriaceae bacterium]
MMRKVMALASTLIVALAAWGQNATTSLHGTVTDPSGAVLTNATVTLTNVVTGKAQSQAVGQAGGYTFNQLDPARYTVSATAPGFGTLTKRIELLVSQPATINLALPVAGASDTVQVVANSTLNFSDASLGNAISNAQIEATPTDSRNVPDLLSLQPGVLYFDNNSSASNPSATQDSRLGAVAGARSDQGNVTLDGLDDNDQVFGYAFTGVLRSTMDSTEEFRVTTANANADAGRSSGAQVTLLTKSGTNAMHGSVYEYYRNAAFAANDWFIKRTQLSAGQPNKPPQLTRNTFGGTIGGPILRDRLFYFFNYEGARTNESTTVTQEVPTAAYASGNVQYKDASGAVDSLSTAQIATMDSGCTANGVCPSGPGVDAAILTYFSAIPVANGLTVGDGLNEGSFTFSSPTPYTHNTSIVKIDWTPAAAHHIFVRGNLQKDVISGAEQFPGQPPQTQEEDNNKGIAAGDTWTLGASLVNDIRYGYIRQGTGIAGQGHGSYTDVRFIAAPTAETRSTLRTVPVNEVTDNLSWIKGRHSFEVGGTWRLIHVNSSTDANSWDAGSTNPQGLNSGSLPSPAVVGEPAVASSFKSNYLNAFGNIIGAESSLTRNINYEVNSGGNTGSLLSQGNFVTRHFINNELEYYLQDSWRPTEKLAITFGIRHTILQVPYEANGQSAAPTIDTDTFFKERQTAAAQGQVYEPTLYFAPNGPVYGRAGYWSKQKANIAPRLAIAYALNSKTSIRTAWGMYYDHFGQGIINAFNQSGSFGLASKITSPLGQLGPEQAPRFTGRTALPNLPVAAGAATQTFPYAPPTDNFSISWGVDNKLQTPYAQVFNLSVQRSLPGGFTLEADYVGRLGRHNLVQSDLATPVNFHDSKSGMSYFQAGAALAAVVDQNNDNSKATVQPIAFFESMFPYMANISTSSCPNPGHTATQAIYCNEWTTYRSVLGETTALADIDFYCSGAVAYGCSPSQSRFWQNQFSSLYSWTSNGASSYNAGQFILRHPMKHGLQMDLSYTLGNSIDEGSDAERSNETLGGSGSYLTNSWMPWQSRAVSDFDTRHLLTFNGSYGLPFGRGQHFASGGRLADLAFGGWRISSVLRWTSGFPFSVGEGGYTTDWEISSYSVKVQNFQAHTVKTTGKVPTAFVNAAAISKSTSTGGPWIRLPYPGEAGQRNAYRGDGYFDDDASLFKPFHITERHMVQFSWEVFNVSNSARFNTRNLTTNPTSGTFGNYSAMLNTPRRQEFSLRYSF